MAGLAYGVPLQPGPERADVAQDKVTPGADNWSRSGPTRQYKGKISISDDSILIADAAFYLKHAADLGINNPYQLNNEQFTAAVNLLKSLKPNVGEWWADYAESRSSRTPTRTSSIGTTWPYQENILKADKKPVEAIKPKEGTTGWSDTWMIYSKAAHPNCMYLWMNYIISPQANAKVAEWFGEAPSTRRRARSRPTRASARPCTPTTRPTGRTSTTGRPRPRTAAGGKDCKTQQDWVNAWTEIRG